MAILQTTMPRGCRFVAAWRVMTEGEVSMPDRHDPTPIPLRLSRKPEPIVLAPRPLVSQAMRDFIHQEITKALYAIGHYDPEPNIVEMSYENFEAFMAQVWEED